MSRDRRSVLLSTVLWLITVFSLGAACASGVLLWTTRGAPVEPAAPAPVVITPRGSLGEAEHTTVELFQNAAPSVVYITALTVRQDYFRRNLQEIPEGAGSGFLWDDRGHVVTNYHVIRGADGARVTLADHSTWPAELVGVAAEKDVAVLRIRAPQNTLRALPIGTSHDLQVGQHAFAIGNPFGLDHTLSTGVISGLDREIMSIGNRPIQGVIQTDAAINPGNSGGPLLDSAGRLIGMNTSILSPSGSSAGVGFAVPVDTIARIVPQLIEHGRVVRPALGVSLDDPRHFGVPITGAMVMGVAPGSPAATAGIQPTRRDMTTGDVLLGDVIVSIDGEAVREPLDLYRILDRREIGQQVRVGLQRGRERVEVQAQLAAIASE